MYGFLVQIFWLQKDEALSLATTCQTDIQGASILVRCSKACFTSMALIDNNAATPTPNFRQK